MKAAFQKKTDLTSVKWRNALLALRGCDETLRHVLRSSGAAWDHVLHLPTRRAGAAGLDESRALLLPSRHQQQVPGIHRQELKSLGLIVAVKNFLFPPNVKVTSLISLLLWSITGAAELSALSPDASSSCCSAHAAPTWEHPESAGWWDTVRVFAEGLWKAHATGIAWSFLTYR